MSNTKKGNGKNRCPFCLPKNRKGEENNATIQDKRNG